MKININRLIPKKIMLFLILFIFVFTTISPVAFGAKLSTEQKNLYDSGIYYYDKGYLKCGSSESAEDNGGVIANPNLYLIGDSYAEGLRDTAKIDTMLKEKGYTTTINAHSGRSIIGGGNAPNPQNALDAIEADKETVKAAGTIVIVLGTNPEDYNTNIPKFLEKIKTINGSSRIFWVNTAHNDPASTKYIKTTNTAIAKYSKTYNYTVVDWFGLYSKDTTLAGGLHPSAKGYKELAKLIISAVGVPTVATELNGYKLPAYSGPTGKERIVDPDGIMRGQGGGDEPIAFGDSFKKLSESDKKAFGNHYITMRWRYASWAWSGDSKTVDNDQLNYYSKNLPRVIVTNPKNKKSIVVAIIESGPGPSIGTKWRKDHGNDSTPAPPWWQDYKVDAPADYDGIVSGITKTTMDALGLTDADLGYDANPKAVKLQYSWAPNQSSTPGTVILNSTITTPSGISTNTNAASTADSFAYTPPKNKFDNSDEQIEKNKEAMYRFLVGKGLTPEQAVGWMGNIWGESNFFPPKIEGIYNYKSYDETSSIYEPGRLQNGFGLVQWTNTQGDITGRRYWVFETAKKQKKDVFTLEFQLNYMWYDLTKNYPNIYKKLLKTKTVYDAHEVILSDYEGPPEKYRIERRVTGVKQANDYLKKYANLTGTDISDNSSTGDECKKSTYIEAPNDGQFVHYSQNVAPWGDLEYPGGGQIKSSGCGLTSYSMIAATLMQDKSITPLTFLNKIKEGGFVISGYRGLKSAQAGKEIYGLNYKELSKSKSEIRAALKSGQYIISGGVYGPYRFKSHIVALTSIDSNDKVTVHDPEDDKPRARYYNLDEFMDSGAYFVAVYR